LQERSNDDRFAMLEGFLLQDPDNAELLHDAAEAALAANKVADALELLDRLSGLRQLTPAEENMRAIAAMRAVRPEVAAAAFAELREASPDDPALSFNHAWALSLAGRHEEAAEALSEQAIKELPQAAMLDVQLAHQAGRFEEAGDLARRHIAAHPGYPPLFAAVSVLAMDIEDEALARQCAEAGGDHPDALTTLGLLTLSDSRLEDARALFAQAEATRPNSPRALIGLGLASLASGDAASAGKFLDRGAEIFGDHLGSWIASGWSYLLAGNVPLARTRFEHALQLDGNFAECHGSLAVIAVLEGKPDAAERKCEIALRLDRQCFSASFAKVLLTAGAGDQARAEKILRIALQQPLGENGQTLAQAIARMAI
jgi:Flp pilus assembly protein TadD